jgi:NADPH2:quinone reductase
MTYTSDPAELQQSAAALFEVVQSGSVRIEVNQRYPLSQAPEAHRALEARETTGSTIFTV